MAVSEMDLAHSVDKVTYYYLFTVDLGFLLERDMTDDAVRDSHEALSRSRRQLLGTDSPLSADQKFIDLGSFGYPAPEREDILTSYSNYKGTGAKEIFTETFLSVLCPYVSDEKDIRFLFNDSFKCGRDVPNVGPGNEYSVGNLRMRYEKTRLRLFPQQALGLEIRFSFADEGADVGEIVRAIAQSRFEQEDLPLVCYGKIMGLVTAIGRANGRYKWIKPANNQESFDLFRRQSESHRILAMNGLRSNGRVLDNDDIFGNSDGLGEKDGHLRAVCGLLNRAEWSSKYWRRTLSRFHDKALAYQSDELFITDGNSTVAIYPRYWDKSSHRYPYFENIVRASHYLLSLKSTSSYLEYHFDTSELGDVRGLVAGLGFVTSVRDYFMTLFRSDRLSQLVRSLFRAQHDVRTVSDMANIETFTNHGFTTRYVEQLILEHRLSAKILALRRKLDGVAFALQTEISPRVNAQNTRLQLFALILAAMSCWIALTKR